MAKTLKLIIEKGPRKGETLEYDPNHRSTIRIGRIVRGNNLTIKDPGISSNHLSIEFDYNSGTWFITDLESSNGTYVNSKLIDVLSGFELNNGDHVKIGELTSIMVEIGGQIEEISTRRNRSRIDSVRNYVEEGKMVSVLGGGDEDVGAGRGGGGGGRRGRGRGRPKKGGVVDGEGEGDGLEVGENVKVDVKASVGRGMSTRRTRSKKNVENIEVDVKASVGRGMNTKRTRSRKNVENVEDRMVSSVLEKVSEIGGLDGDEEGLEVAENVEVGVKESVGRGMGMRRTRRRKNVGNVEDRMVSSVLEKVPESEGLNGDGEVGKSVGRGMSTRRTRNQKNVEDRMVSSVLGKVPESEGLNGNDEGLDVGENVEADIKANMGGGMSTRRTRSQKNVEDRMVSSVLEKVPESDDLKGDGGMKGENVGVVEDEKKRDGGRVMEKVVDDVCLDGVGDVNLDDGKNMEVSDVQPCEENFQKMFEVGELRVPQSEALNGDDGEKVASVGVVEDKEKQEDCGGKIEELLDVQSREEPVDESYQQKMLEERRLDVPESETSNGYNGENVENVAVVEDKEKQVGHDKPSVDIGSSDDASDVHPCEDPVDENSQQNMHEERKLEVSEMKVIEQEVGEVVTAEKLSEVKMAATEQITVEKSASEVSQQELSEPDRGIPGTEEQPFIELNGEPNETVVSGSHVDQETCNVLQNDEVSKEEEVDESEESEFSDGSCEDSEHEEKKQEAVAAPDLEKMTLGEWFDYLEVWLPKQIRDVTDEIVADMRNKAKQYDEFMLEQQKKGRLPVVP